MIYEKPIKGEQTMEIPSSYVLDNINMRKMIKLFIQHQFQQKTSQHLTQLLCAEDFGHRKFLIEKWNLARCKNDARVSLNSPKITKAFSFDAEKLFIISKLC